MGDGIVCITDLRALFTQPYRALLALITKEVRSPIALSSTAAGTTVVSCDCGRFEIDVSP